MADIVIQAVVQFLKLSWWFWAALILWPLFRSTWLYWRQELYKRSREFKMTILEICIPREIRKSPRAMEQVFMAIHSLRNAPGDLREKWWDGEVTKWYALEMVSFGGQIRFFIRFYYKQRPLIEAAFFSYYPDVELTEVDDYVDQFPQSAAEMHRQGYDLWGTEMILAKEEAYPIRTYLEFESPEEEKQYDPISAFLEILGKVKKEEIVGIQILIAPKSPNWHEKWRGLVEGLRERKERTKARYGSAVEFPGGPLPAMSTTGSQPEQKPLMASFMRTPGETDVLKAVESNLSKPAFDTLIRFIYLSPKTLYYDTYPRRGLTGAFNQYAALDLNAFVQNFTISTRTKFWNWPHLFPGARNKRRKANLLYNYIRREVPPETFIGRLITSNFLRWNFASRRFAMNTQCLATLFHPPTYLVLTAPHVKRVESRKTGPPAGLAIFGEEREIEKYQ